MTTFTIQTIKEYAAKTGKPIEINYPQSTIITQNTDNETSIGIELKQNIWYWWTSFEVEGDILFFKQRYNRNSGAIQRSHRKGWDASLMILNNAK